MRAFWAEYWTGCALGLVLCLVAAALVFTAPVEAATPNGCAIVGTVGTVIVALCQDEDSGLMVWANSAGMMTAGQQ